MLQDHKTVTTYSIVQLFSDIKRKSYPINRVPTARLLTHYT